MGLLTPPGCPFAVPRDRGPFAGARFPGRLADQSLSGVITAPAFCLALPGVFSQMKVDRRAARVDIAI
jgi:hypothetical protein